MAIFDTVDDGTTKFEIKALYDDDGTAKHQIAKVYDNDGTVNSLIYSAETVYFENGTQGNNWQSYNLDAGYDTVTIGTTLHANCYGSVSHAVFWLEADLTDIKTLKFTFSKVSGGNIYCGVTDKTGSAINNFQGPYLVSKAAAVGTVSVDVSSITGTHNIAVALIESAGADIYFTVTKVTGE